MDLQYNDMKFIWWLTDGDKGVMIESRYVSAPYCSVTYRGTEVISNPEGKVKEILSGIFGESGNIEIWRKAQKECIANIDAKEVEIGKPKSKKRKKK